MISVNRKTLIDTGIPVGHIPNLRDCDTVRGLVYYPFTVISCHAMTFTWFLIFYLAGSSPNTGFPPPIPSVAISLFCHWWPCSHTIAESEETGLYCGNILCEKNLRAKAAQKKSKLSDYRNWRLFAIVTVGFAREKLRWELPMIR